MFWIATFFKTDDGVILMFASFEKYAYRPILMIDHRKFDDVKETKDFIALFPLTALTVSHLSPEYAWLYHVLQHNQSPNEQCSSPTIMVILIKA